MFSLIKLKKPSMQCNHHNRACVDSREEESPSGDKYRRRTYHCNTCHYSWHTIEVEAGPTATVKRGDAYSYAIERLTFINLAAKKVQDQWRKKAAKFDEIKEYIKENL